MFYFSRRLARWPLASWTKVLVNLSWDYQIYGPIGLVKALMTIRRPND